MAESEQQSVTEDQGLIMERVFNAPRELVWRAWTEPERFASWYGPQGFTVPTCEMDFRVGGSYSLVMRSRSGTIRWVDSVHNFAQLDKARFRDA